MPDGGDDQRGGAGQSGPVKSIRPGDRLLALNGHEIADVLDYRFYLDEPCLTAVIETPEGKRRVLRLHRDAGGETGLTFASYLMDKQHRCRNKCVFCFIDQMPPGMREACISRTTTAACPSCSAITSPDQFDRTRGDPDPRDAHQPHSCLGPHHQSRTALPDDGQPFCGRACPCCGGLRKPASAWSASWCSARVITTGTS